MQIIRKDKIRVKMLLFTNLFQKKPTTHTQKLPYMRAHFLVRSAPSKSSPSAAPSISSETAPSSSSAGLSSENARLSATGSAAAASPAVSHVLEHRGVLQHIRKNQEPDLRSSDVDVLELGHTPVTVGHGHAGHLAV